MSSALVIGNSDGIGLGFSKKLLKLGWTVTGISKSESPIQTGSYRHYIADVNDREYNHRLQSVLQNKDQMDLCLYCAGIGELLNPLDMGKEVETIDVNLTGMIKTLAVVIPAMVENGHGHFIGLSSVADEMLSPEAPAYHASKAGMSNYLESLALALKPKGIYVTNVRFGFVDTKMAKGDVKPFMMGVDKACEHLLYCMAKKPVRYTAPKIIIPLTKFRQYMLKLKTL
ncbi:SDR family NAD(P)-dependent oxidoreductase [candidate division KSB1 bacterium]|nr:SDR family NAD(P)-dependent oxidoreductase [candidate division KSB1 bacterium]